MPCRLFPGRSQGPRWPRRVLPPLMPKSILRHPPGPVMRAAFSTTLASARAGFASAQVICQRASKRRAGPCLVRPPRLVVVKHKSLIYSDLPI